MTEPEPTGNQDLNFLVQTVERLERIYLRRPGCSEIGQAIKLLGNLIYRWPKAEQ